MIEKKLYTKDILALKTCREDFQVLKLDRDRHMKFIDMHKKKEGLIESEVLYKQAVVLKEKSDYIAYILPIMKHGEIYLGEVYIEDGRDEKEVFIAMVELLAKNINDLSYDKLYIEINGEDSYYEAIENLIKDR